MKPCTHSHHHCISEALSQAETFCARQGLRFTDLRRKVFEIIWQSHKAMTAADVMAKLDNNQPPTTYRALEFLESNSLIHRVAALNAFVGCIHPNEEHISQLFICEDCRNVTEVISPELGKLIDKEAKHQSFHIRERHLELLGRCHTCAKAA